uniref:Uncharacterized protein n=1 Tax=Ciona savignyi TaxID=51511 RepID=H2ZR32_CIOSA
MVFESLVVDLLNKYLGKYIENLDASQLKLGIWGGDAVLENLLIKSDVLKELDVPFQISYGFLGKLTLKIPWKNLYKDSVEATVDGLYLLVVPDTSDTYDAAKQAKWEQDAKQAMLKAIEDKEIQSLQAYNYTGIAYPKSANLKKDEVQQDGFVEKLASQIIRNVQIHIHNIHIRYEDQVLFLKFKLYRCYILFQTTDENWVPTTLDESISNIFKLVDLQYFSMYWNSSPNDYFKDFPPSQQLFLLKNTIASKTVLPQDFSYIIRPIKMQAQLEINPKSHVDLKPKISVTLEVNELGFQLLHSQYHGVLLLLDDIDRMAINSHFRKYRPAVRVVGNSSKWWKYALQCINDSVIVHTRQWNWEYIKKHRDNVRHYKAKYKLKLESKYPDQTLLDQLIEIENTLDVFNITLAKKMSEIEVLSRDGIQIRNADYVQLHSTSSSTGWFGGWFSKRTPESKKPKENKGLDAVMTTEEKKKLYLSIGYSEGELVDDSKLPKSYVDIHLNVKVKKLSLELRNTMNEDLLMVSFQEINSIIEQRPSAKAFCVCADIHSFLIHGMPQQGHLPIIVSPEHAEQTLFRFVFETNPLDESCDQRVKANANPLKITYDAVTINSLVDFVTPPQQIKLQGLRNVAASTYNDVKEQTTTSLKSIIQTKTITQIEIQFSSSYFILPMDGYFLSTSNVLVLDLGELLVKSLSSRNKDLVEDESRIYDVFHIDVQNIQLLLSMQGEVWKEARSLPTSSLHIIQPIGISVDLEKCLVDSDPTLPIIKVSGILPSIGLKVSDQKLLHIIQLVQSIPLPTAQPIPDEELFVSILCISQLCFSSQSSSEDDFFTADSDSRYSILSKKVKSRTKLKELPGVQQMTNLQLNFTINQITLSICEEYSSTSMDEVLNLHVNALSSNVKVRTWDTSIELSLQSLIVNHSQFTTSENGVLPFLHTQADPQSEVAFQGKVIQANPKSPDFVKLYHQTLQTISLQLGLLHVTVHVQAILKLQSFITSLTQLLSESITDEVNVQPSNYAKLNLVDSKTSLDEISNVVNLSMMLKVECLDVTVIDQHETLSTLKVEGVQSCVMLTAPWNQFSMKIHNLVVRDVGTDLLYPHIVSAVGNEVVKMDFTSYNATIDETTGSGGITVDANLKMELGCLRVVFLSKFVDKLVGYGKKFSETKEIAKAVGSAAQEKAVATAQELMMTHPCIKMDICLSAPTIIVPVHSKSIEVLVLDLGVLQAENVFTEVGKVGNKIAIMDQMKISLTDVQVLRRSFNIDMTSYSEHNLLQPVDLKVKVDRNLSSTWFHNAPDMSIDSVLHQLSVSLSQGDLRFIMQVLELNIWEEHEHM